MQSTDLGVKIGSRIRASRMSIGLTQEQLAEKVGVSWSTISSLERGMHMVSLERLLDICEALNSGLEIICELPKINPLNAGFHPNNYAKFTCPACLQAYSVLFCSSSDVSPEVINARISS